MSRSTLRRQMVHKNLLIQSGGRQSLGDGSGGEDQLSRCYLSVDNGTNGDWDAVRNSMTRTPIYRPSQLNNGASDVALLKDFNTETSNVKVFDCPRPGTPYTEIDYSNVDYSKHAKVGQRRKNSVPLVFQFPDTTNRDDDAPPFSPIPRHSRSLVRRGSSESGPSRRSSIWDRSCRACHEVDDNIPALPMSPAAYLQTSTPAPKDMVKTSGLCDSILESSHCIFNFTDGNMCRICHEDDTMMPLVSPCHCTGTMGMLHIACLETWLGSSNTTKCEICQFQFTVLRKARPIKWYLKEPSLYSERREVVRDVVLCVALGLLVLFISILSLVFADRLTDEGKPVGATILILVTTSAIIMYIAWIALSARRIYRMFGKWQTEHHVIHIKQRANPHTIGHGLFRRFTFHPRRLGSKKLPPVPNPSPLGSYETLESYKAAMYNPVVPPFPDINNNRVTSPGRRQSDAVTCPDYGEDTAAVVDVSYQEECTVMYYQPPECGSTSILYTETGQLLRETGV